MRYLPYIVVLAAIAGFTYLEGVVSERWTGAGEAARRSAVVLKEIPTRIGEWEGEDEEVDDEIQRVAGAQGFISRIFRNKRTGETVSVWLVVGHAHYTAAHTPDICYPSAGFRQYQKNARFNLDVDGKSVEFWTGLFRQDQGLGVSNQRVFWTWFLPQPGATELEWKAPESPRFTFGGARALFKLYFTAAAADESERPEESVALEFAKEFLPVVGPILAKVNGDPAPPATSPEV
jgi:hypothetical protein